MRRFLCPTKSLDFNAVLTYPEPSGGGQLPAVTATYLLSPTEDAELTAAKGLFPTSLSAGIDFAKFMIPICSAEVPTYFAILKFAGLTGFTSPGTSLLYLAAAIPAVLFVAAGLLFAIGAFPQIFRRATLDSEHGEHELYRKVSLGRVRYVWVGMFVFVAANLIAIIMTSSVLVWG